MDQYCSLQNLFIYFGKGPQTPSDSFGMMVSYHLVWYNMTWYGMVTWYWYEWDMV